MPLMPYFTEFKMPRVKEVENPVDQLPSILESDYLAILNKPGMPSHRLQLKIGTICSIMRNLSIEKGLVKNARIRIFELRRYIVRVKFLHSASFFSDDRSVYLSRINFNFYPQYTSWTVKRHQFLFRLIYAITFNSC
jgi:hypothetical protein